MDLARLAGVNAAVTRAMVGHADAAEMVSILTGVVSRASFFVARGGRGL
jgi:hypothetical protein